jgi:hypothetical protein
MEEEVLSSGSYGNVLAVRSKAGQQGNRTIDHGE